MDRQRLNEVRDGFGIDAETALTLRRLFDLVSADIPTIVNGFLECILRDPEVIRRSVGKQRDLHCLKQSLVGWLRSTLACPHDGSEYFESRQRIGRVHVQIELPQELMLLAMNSIREDLLALAVERIADPRDLSLAVHAVNRVLDLELTLILDSYRENQQEKLKAHERLATIGQVAASIGHELRNPLGTIESSVFLLSQKLERLGVKDESMDRHVQKARKQVQLCSKIISDLLELARSRTPTRRRVNVANIVDEALEALAWPIDVSRTKALVADLSVYADPEQLRSVIVNLLENARDALKDNGEIQIEAAAVNGGVFIRIRDNGPGIDQKDRARIFDPLYTTKSHGNGLGLALCRRIVSAHGGTIELEDGGIGACFSVWLPDEVVHSADVTANVVTWKVFDNSKRRARQWLK